MNTLSSIPNRAKTAPPREGTVPPAPRIAPHARAGFTLLELLAAISILLVIVWMMARIFTESDRAWNFGSSQAETSIEARAALQMINHDLQYAIVDNNLTFVVRPAAKRAQEVSNPSTITTNIYNRSVSELCFVSLQHDSTPNASGDPDPRAVREIHYYVKPMTNGIARYELMRGYWSTEIAGTDPVANTTNFTFQIHSYHNPDWFRSGAGNPGRPTSAQVIAENVCAFEAHVNYSTITTLPNGLRTLTTGLTTDYLSSSHNFRLPESVDLCIAVLSERDTLQLLQMQSNPLLAPRPNFDPIGDYIERNARRFVTRVYFHNRLGYRNRGGVW